MRARSFFISTQKEAPADAEVVSQKLMLRAGMIKKLAAGVYTYMPMGLRSIRKIEAIIRDEMNQAGAVELLMPVVQPAELWQESGRWQKYGPELLRVKDRHDRDFIIQPTSEEVITDVARQEIKSWRQLPVNFYHIQTKFRDERRPRFGVMRGREFTMKDAYSFDRDVESALKSYDTMYGAYTKIFGRLGLTFRAVAADTGAIGGDRSHEFQVIADTGEDLIAYCPDSDYAANIELAEAVAMVGERAAATQALVKTATPGQEKCEGVAAFLALPLAQTVKSIVLAVDRTNDKGDPLPAQIVLLLIRGDHALNEVKAGKLAALKTGFRFATESEILATFGSKPGYLGPIGVAEGVAVIADRTVANMSDFVCGANEEGFHFTGANWGRDLPEPVVADLRNVVEGDPSPDGKGVLKMQRGIEVGHVFYLGTKYSQALNAKFLDETGKPKIMEMGCYGIGVTRLLGAAIEQNHDDKGIIWPDSIAPFTVVVCPVGLGKSEQVKQVAEKLYDDLKAAGVDVILDDRDERPGVMFADWELIGVPHRVTIGDRALKNGEVEYVHRRGMQSQAVPMDDAFS
ncbi:MAG: proline--tRNA ligase, partial [Burkholderiaceae bacterium]